MLKIENVDIFGWEAAIRGMRNPKNSWEKSDSGICSFECTDSGCPWGCEDKDEPECCLSFHVGKSDLKLMRTLAHAGSDHGKFLRMINVTLDITAPLYWWKEFDTYKVGTVANSCSTMHKIAAKEFTLDDFSHEHLWDGARMNLETTISSLNVWRDAYNHPGATGDYKKQCWWQMIQTLPSSYNQKRTVQLNYEVLRNMYHARKNHKLDEWHILCDWIETLPYFRDICLEGTETT